MHRGLAVCAAALALGACRGAAPARSTAADGSLTANATVDRVVDGDTIDVVLDGAGPDDSERVRLIGIDTPEVAHAAAGTRPGNPAECFGPEASEYTTSLLPAGTRVRIERDVVSRDDYGRLLGYVYRASDAIFVNYEIVRQGYARPLTIPPNVAHRDTFVEAARAAERDDAGLWQLCR